MNPIEERVMDEIQKTRKITIEEISIKHHIPIHETETVCKHFANSGKIIFDPSDETYKVNWNRK